MDFRSGSNCCSLLQGQNLIEKPRSRVWRTVLYLSAPMVRNWKKSQKSLKKTNIIPAVDPTEFTLDQVNEALHLVASGHPKGKVVIKVSD